MRVVVSSNTARKSLCFITRGLICPELFSGPAGLEGLWILLYTNTPAASALLLAPTSNVVGLPLWISGNLVRKGPHLILWISSGQSQFSGRCLSFFFLMRIYTNRKISLFSNLMKIQYALLNIEFLGLHFLPDGRSLLYFKAKCLYLIPRALVL